MKPGDHLRLAIALWPLLQLVPRVFAMRRFVAQQRLWKCTEKYEDERKKIEII